MNNIAVIFDMDGLIFDTERLALTVWTDCMKKMGHDLQFPVFSRLLGLSNVDARRILKEEFGEDLDCDSLFDRCWEALMHVSYTEGVDIKRGAVDFLEFLKAQGIKTALASSSPMDHILRLLEQTKLRDYFQVIASGDQVDHSKPNPEIFLKSAAELGINPADCVVFEDSEAGTEAAWRAGMYPVIVPDLKEPGAETKSRAYRIVPSLSSGAELILDLMNRPL